MTKKRATLKRKLVSGIRAIAFCDAAEWTKLKLTIMSGNLKEGSKLRELRCDLQVTLTELADWLWDNTDADFPVANISCISKVERGLRITEAWEHKVLRAAVRSVSSEAKPKARRLLRRRRASAEQQDRVAA